MVDIEPTAVFSEICGICKYFKKFIELESMVSKKKKRKATNLSTVTYFRMMSCHGNFTGSAIKHKAKKLAPFTINYPLLIFNRLLLRSSGVLDFMTLLHFLSFFGLTLPGFHTSSDMYELSKSICWNHLQQKSVIFVADCRLDNRLP